MKIALRVLTTANKQGAARRARWLEYWNEADLSICSSAEFSLWLGKPSPNGVARNALDAWRSGLEDKEATHVFVTQDDMRPVKQFSMHVAGALDACPVDMVALFSGARSQVRRARDLGVAWVWGHSLFCGNGTVLTRAAVKDFLRFADPLMYASDRFVADDNLYTAYQIAREKECWVTVPHLLQHFCPQDSTIGHNSPILVGRTAEDWVEDLPDPIDWEVSQDLAPRAPTVAGSVTKRLLDRCVS